MNEPPTDAAPLRACPCCGAAAYAQPPGSYEICGRCGWEDDPVQERDPALAGGANRLALADARRAWLLVGTSDPLTRPRDRG